MRKVYHKWWFRFFYVFQSVVLLLPILYIYYNLPQEPFFNPPMPVKAILFVIFASSIGFALYAAKSYDNMSFLGIRQVKDYFTGKEKRVIRQKLTRKGALSVVRHPYYSASLFAIWSRPLEVKDLYLNVLLTIYFILGTINEERKLKKEFGQEYLDYMKEVPALIPFIKRKG
jgi:protein-S-isoprenylcysteine O-methyltransferase Ste14